MRAVIVGSGDPVDPGFLKSAAKTRMLLLPPMVEAFIYMRQALYLIFS